MIENIACDHFASIKCEKKTHRFCHLFVIFHTFKFHRSFCIFCLVLLNAHNVIVFEIFFHLQVVDAKVIQLDYNNNRIFLSLKDVKVLGLIPLSCKISAC